jgi:hypothetical protein
MMEIFALTARERIRWRDTFLLHEIFLSIPELPCVGLNVIHLDSSPDSISRTICMAIVMA